MILKTFLFELQNHEFIWEPFYSLDFVNYGYWEVKDAEELTGQIVVTIPHLENET